MVLVVKSQPANAGRYKKCRFDPWVGKIDWRRAQQPTPVFLENPMDRGAWQAAVHRLHSQIQLKRFSTHFLSSISLVLNLAGFNMYGENPHDTPSLTVVQ